MFDPEVYQNRRKNLAKTVGSGVILFFGNDESPMNYADNPYPFRQDSSFLYYWGLDEPNLAAIIDVDEQKEILFGYDFSVDDIIWMGPQPSLAERAARAGIKEISPINKLASEVQKADQQRRKIHYLPQYRPENRIKIQQILGIQADMVDYYASVELICAVVTQRSVKSNEEIQEIEKALDISYEMHTLAMKMVRPGIYEREVVGAMVGKAYAMGGGISFPIVFSIHGETLHNHHHDNLMEEGNIVVNDSGGESPMHYAGDITRTIPVSGKFTPQQKEIYQIVLNAQRKAIEAIRPGIKYRDVHLLAAKEMAKGLADVGIMKGNLDEAVAQGAHALFFPHGLGHMMGLDVHDMENLGEDYVGYNEEVQRSSQFGLAYLRLAKALQPGYVLTVEPGIYFIPELIDQWKAEHKFEEFINYQVVEKYRQFGGIRIEDDILVTPNGHKLLCKPIPKTVEEVEALTSS